MPTTSNRFFLWCVLAIGAFTPPALAQLSLVPASPIPLDLVRLRWTHAGCTNPDSVRVSMQSNRVTVSADRTFPADCGTVQGYFDEYTIGRLPSGQYEVQLVVNPPPPTLGPSLLIGPVQLEVGPLPHTGALLPHEDYTDVWWDPNESGQSLTVKQSGAELVAGWNVYDVSGRAIWYTLQPGAWARDSANNLYYAGIVYKTSGPYWGGPFDPGALSIATVGTANFVPQSVSRARFDYVIEGVSGSKQLQRFVF